MGEENVPSSNARKPYTVSNERTLEKKMQAAERQIPISCQLTGGGLVIEADAAHYEALKYTIC